MTSSNRPSARAATLAVTAAFALLTLAACGGGGGGGSTSTMPPGGGGGGEEQTIPTRAAALTNSATAANAATKIAEAAVARPAPGSVTQSSNVDSGNVTIDRVEVTAQHGSVGPGFSVRNGTAWSAGTSDGNPRRISDTAPPWQGVELGKRIADGTLYVDAYTDIEAPGLSPGRGSPQAIGAGDRVVFAEFPDEETVGEALEIGGTRNGVPGTFSCPDPSTCVRDFAAFVVESVTVRFDEVQGVSFIPDDGSDQQAVGVGDTIVLTQIPDDEFDLRVGLHGTRDGVPGTIRVDQSCSGDCSWEYELTLSLSGHFSEAPESVFIPSTGTTVATPDADYLAGGVWLIVPDDATSAADFGFGAFADGSDPFTQSNLVPVMGTATYRGDAAGVYSAKEAGAATVGYLDADVRLTADFGDASGLGTIGGSMTDFVVDEEPHAGALNLGTANIGAQDSGFFIGAVTGADGQRSYTGHWGGQFFGNGQADGRPGSVAGTFGAHSADDAISFVGAFGAHKQ